MTRRHTALSSFSSPPMGLPEIDLHLRPVRQPWGPPESGAAGFSGAAGPAAVDGRELRPSHHKGQPPTATVPRLSRAMADQDWRAWRPQGDRGLQQTPEVAAASAAPAHTPEATPRPQTTQQPAAAPTSPQGQRLPRPWASQGAGLITPPSSASSASSPAGPSSHSASLASSLFLTPRFRRHGLTAPPGLEESRGRYPIAECFEGAEIAYPPPGSARHRLGPSAWELWVQWDERERRERRRRRERWTARHERVLSDLRLRMPNFERLRREALEEEEVRPPTPPQTSCPASRPSVLESGDLDLDLDLDLPALSIESGLLDAAPRAPLPSPTYPAPNPWTLSRADGVNMPWPRLPSLPWAPCFP